MEVVRVVGCQRAFSQDERWNGRNGSEMGALLRHLQSLNNVSARRRELSMHRRPDGREWGVGCGVSGREVEADCVH
eukprot:scaffold2339_cov180-Alexandrium_tamarense.AAC.3